jgi:hypothetical protein
VDIQQSRKQKTTILTLQESFLIFITIRGENRSIVTSNLMVLVDVEERGDFDCRPCCYDLFDHLSLYQCIAVNVSQQETTDTVLFQTMTSLV